MADISKGKAKTRTMTTTAGQIWRKSENKKLLSYFRYYQGKEIYHHLPKIMIKVLFL